MAGDVYVMPPAFFALRDGSCVEVFSTVNFARGAVVVVQSLMGLECLARVDRVEQFDSILWSVYLREVKP